MISLSGRGEGAVELTETFAWDGREIAWTRAGPGPPVGFCHGTPWSSRTWAPYAEALADRCTVYLWDLPGYGGSSKDPAHDVHAGVHVVGQYIGTMTLDHNNDWSSVDI